MPVVLCQDGVIDDESLVKTWTNICLSYASAVPSYSVVVWSLCQIFPMGPYDIIQSQNKDTQKVDSDQKSVTAATP